MSQIVLQSRAQAASHGSAVAVQVSGNIHQDSPFLYVIKILPDGTQVPQQPYTVFVENLFTALEQVSETYGKKASTSYSFNFSSVVEFKVQFLRDGALLDTRYLSSGNLETGANWYFQSTQSIGKNAGELRNGYVNDILGSTGGGERAVFTNQPFTVNSAGLYTWRLWVTVMIDNKPLQVFKEFSVNVQPFYELF